MSLQVLVVDDSVATMLEAAGGFEVTAAATAAIALKRLAQCVPDVVIMDVEMPEMDGIEAVRVIRASWPRLPVLMCSTLSSHGADATLRALAAGASDFVPKPSAGRAAEFAVELAAKVRALAGGASEKHPDACVYRKTPLATVDLVAVGASTGGPGALAVFLGALPRDLRVPIVIVQHMPPVFTQRLAERLTATTGFPVAEATDGEGLVGGRAYLAPGGLHLVVERSERGLRAKLDRAPPENSCRPSVDVLFRSVASVARRGAVGVVLTGMGRDGASGARSLVDEGGAVLVQDAASCVVASMPGAVAELGIAEGAYPIEALGAVLAARIRGPGARAS